MIRLFVALLLSCRINLPNGHLIESNNTESNVNLVDELFYKYSNSTNALSLSNLRDFLEKFPKLLISNGANNDENLSGDSLDCLNRNIIKITNLTHNLSNQTLIDKKKLSVISLFLVSFMEKCFSEQKDGFIDEFQQNLNSSEQENIFQSIFNYNKLVYLYENALNLKRESKGVVWYEFCFYNN